MKLYMFRTVPLSIVSLFTVNSAMVFVIQACRQLSSRTRMELQFHPCPAYTTSVSEDEPTRFETRRIQQKLNINLENCAFRWFVLYHFWIT